MTESPPVQELETVSVQQEDSPKPAKRDYEMLGRQYVGLFFIAATVIVLDQITKGLVRTNLAFAERWMPIEWLAPYVRIVNWRNTGAAFGIFQSAGDIFTLLAFVVIGIILFYYPQIPRHEWPVRLALGLQLGGATGNLIDRLRFGYVTDYVSVLRFPVFNVADSSITIGVIVLVLGVWIIESQQQMKEALGGEAEEPVTSE